MAEAVKPSAQAGQVLDMDFAGRSEEDYLDWLENHPRIGRGSRGRAAAVIGIACTVMAAIAAALAFTAF